MSNQADETTSQGGFSGARLVVVLLGAVAALVGAVLIGFALFEPESAPCATGDLARNEFVDGAYVPRTESFDSVHDAEAFICHEVPELGAPEWELEEISAERRVSLERLVEGSGVGFVTLGYIETDSEQALVIESAPFFGPSFFESQIPPQRTEETVLIGAIEGTAYHFGINPNQVEVLWHEDTLEHRAVAQLDDGFTLEGLIEVLETLQ